MLIFVILSVKQLISSGAYKNIADNDDHHKNQAVYFNDNLVICRLKLLALHKACHCNAKPIFWPAINGILSS